MGRGNRSGLTIMVRSNTRGSGILTTYMARARRAGEMAKGGQAHMKVIGASATSMGRGNRSGLTIMVRSNTRGSGILTRCMARARRAGEMAKGGQAHMKVIGASATSMGRENRSGLTIMVRSNTRGSGILTTYMARARRAGEMAKGGQAHMKVIGASATSMGR